LELTDSFTVVAPVATVWEVLWDFPRLAACLPGCDQIERSGDNSYRARMRQAIGPFRLEMDLTLTVVELAPGQRIAFTGWGADRQGNRLKLSRAVIQLTPTATGGTEVGYAADFNLLGKLATLGYPIVKRKAKELGSEFGQRLEEIIVGGRTHG